MSDRDEREDAHISGVRKGRCQKKPLYLYCTGISSPKNWVSSANASAQTEDEALIHNAYLVGYNGSVREKGKKKLLAVTLMPNADDPLSILIQNYVKMVFI